MTPPPDEREAIVRYIRNRADCYDFDTEHWMEQLADAIERGDHLPSEGEGYE